MWIIVLHIVLHNYATNFQLQTGNCKLRIANYDSNSKFSEHFDTDSVQILFYPLEVSIKSGALWGLSSFRAALVE